MVNYLDTFIWIADNDATADVLTSTGDIASFGIFNVVERLTLYRVGALIKTLVATDTAEAVITFDKRITTDSDTGRVEPLVSGALLTIPDTTVVGKIVYEDITPTELSPGDQVVPEVTTAGTDGASAAGAYLPVLYLRRTDYTAAKETDMVVDT